MHTIFRARFLAHCPPRKARMCEPGSPVRSITYPHPITDSEIRAHLGSQLTLAAPLVGFDGQVVAACDVLCHREPLRPAETVQRSLAAARPHHAYQGGI